MIKIRFTDIFFWIFILSADILPIGSGGDVAVEDGVDLDEI